MRKQFKPQIRKSCYIDLLDMVYSVDSKRCICFQNAQVATYEFSLSGQTLGNAQM